MESTFCFSIVVDLQELLFVSLICLFQTSLRIEERSDYYDPCVSLCCLNLEKFEVKTKGAQDHYHCWRFFVVCMNFVCEWLCLRVDVSEG